MFTGSRKVALPTPALAMAQSMGPELGPDLLKRGFDLLAIPHVGRGDSRFPPLR